MQVTSHTDTQNISSSGYYGGITRQLKSPVCAHGDEDTAVAT